MEGRDDQHHRHPRPRRLHGRGRALAPRPRRRGRRLLGRRGGRGAERDRLAAGDASTTSPGSASSTRWTASAPSSTGSSTRSQERLEGHPIPVQIPIGAGPEGTMGEFQGLIDLIAMKALYYKTEDLGSTITEAEIPEDLLPDAELWRERMLNALGDFDEAFTEAVHGPPGGGRADRGADRRRAAAGHADRPRAAGPLRLELQVRRRPAAPRRRRRLPAQPARQAAGRRAPPQEGDRGHPPAEPRRALLRPGLQDHQRRPRRPLVRPHLLGPAEGRQPRLQPRPRQEGELLAALPHPRRRPREGRAGRRPATSSASSA